MQEDNTAARLRELCLRSKKQHQPVYTRFLSPPEAQMALHTAKEQHVDCLFYGGYPSAERVMACFAPEDEEPDFPLACIHITWNARYGGADHRAILGSVMGLGIERSMVGDICLAPEGAYLMTSAEMAAFIVQNLVKAGRTPVVAHLLAEVPPLAQADGKAFRDTVASLRLDAVLAAGLSISRANAAQYIKDGLLQVNHRQEMRPDASLREGDLLSIRGRGRLVLTTVGAPTRKGRIPIEFESHGIH